jgi:CHASE2 domain-containing sensor protein
MLGSRGGSKTNFTLVILGLIVLAILSVIRGNGAFQVLELRMLDLVTQIRGLVPEKPDSRITIFELRDQDIGADKAVKYPMPYHQLIKIVTAIKECNPAVIGIDLYGSDVEGSENTRSLSSSSGNLVLTKTIKPPFLSSLPGFSLQENQANHNYISFSEPVRDLDGNTRRYLLGSYATELQRAESKFFLSMGFLLSSLYLGTHGNFHVGNGLSDKYAVRFYQPKEKSLEIPRVFDNFGGYNLTKEASRGIQMMVNYRSNPLPFSYISISDLGTSRLCAASRDRVVLIGFRSNQVHLEAFYSRNPYQALYRVDINAHATSQIISAVLDGRPLIRAAPDYLEWLIFLAAWLLGLIFCLTYKHSAFKLIVVIFGFSLTTTLFTVGLLTIWGLWIPAAQILLAFCLLNLLTLFHHVYKSQLLLEFQVQQRRRIIEETFNIIHNGPLQRVAYLMRTAYAGNPEPSEMLSQLTEINSELRSLGDELRQESLFTENSFSLGCGHRIAAEMPFDKALYEVYQTTIERTDLENFQSILFKTVKFDPIEESLLSFEKRKNIYLFLEEALVNVGKHAKQASRLKVVGQLTPSTYILCVEDRSTQPSERPSSSRRGYGTTLFLKTQRMLGGSFQQRIVHNRDSQPVGTVCELSWPLRSSLQQLISWLSAIARGGNNGQKKIFP